MKRLPRKVPIRTIDGFGGTALILILSFNCLNIVIVASKEHGNPAQPNQKIYQAEIPSNEEHEISILIGARDAETGSSRAGGVSVNADDDGGSGNSTGSGSVSESSSYDRCSNPNSRCCYQYTWPGFQDVIPEAENATCDFLRKQRRDDTIACFDPMVYTISRTGDQRGTPPNWTDLERGAEENANWKIFCVSQTKSCITYSYFNDDKKMENQTKFCGVVTNNEGDGGRLVNGCYRQKVGGYVREVCVCTGNLCNKDKSSSSLLQFSRALGLLSLVTMMYAFR